MSGGRVQLGLLLLLLLLVLAPSRGRTGVRMLDRKR